MINIGLEEHRKYIINNYKYVSGNWDIYMAFFEKGLNLSKKLLCYITPDKWLSRPFGLKFRQQCMMSRMSEILHIGNKVFENVKVDGVISLFTLESDKLTAMKFDDNNKVQVINSLLKKDLNSPYLIDFLFSEHFNIIKKIEDVSSKKLSDYLLCENACATSDAYKLVPFIKNKQKFDNKDDFALINTGTIDKYISKWGKKEITYLGKKYLYPVVNKKKFIDNFGKSYISKVKKPKIIIKGLNLLDACVDFKGEILPGKTTLVICNEDIDLLKIVCAIINSKMATFYIKNKYSSSSYCGGLTFTKEMFNNLPLPKDIIKHSIIKQIENIINKKQENIQANTAEHEKKIDQIIYELYELTDEEIAIIESY